MIRRAHVVYAQHLVWTHLTKERQLVDNMAFQRRRTPRCDKVRHKTQATQVANRRLSRLRLLFPANHWDERHMN